MTAAGAQGKTLAEMLEVLSGTEDALHGDHEKLRADLENIESRSIQIAADYARIGAPAPAPTVLRVANRLFAEKNFSFLPQFLALTEARYRAPLEQLSFRLQPEAARLAINAWVEKQTLSKIQNLLGPSDISPDTSLILVNALYFQAPWQNPFPPTSIRPEPFHTRPDASEDVPTLVDTQTLGYQRLPAPDSTSDLFEAVSIPYTSGTLQFLILLPGENSSVSVLESKLTAELLSSCSRLARRPVTLHLPKLHIAPPTLSLRKTLLSLGMASAFDEPPGTADFSRMSAPNQNRLVIGDVLHKTFLDLDEKGTEAAAATAVVMLKATSIPGKPQEPVVVRVNRPFLFAIQHVQSGTCLFLGRLQKP
jgi:serpin B